MIPGQVVDAFTRRCTASHEHSGCPFAWGGSIIVIIWSYIMLMHRLCPLSRLLPRRIPLVTSPFMPMHLKGRALHTPFPLQQPFFHRRQCRNTRRAACLRSCASAAPAVSNVAPVSAPTSENVIQLLRARGLIQVQAPSAIIEQSRFLMACMGACCLQSTASPVVGGNACPRVVSAIGCAHQMQGEHKEPGVMQNFVCTGHHERCTGNSRRLRGTHSLLRFRPNSGEPAPGEPSGHRRADLVSALRTQACGLTGRRNRPCG